MNESVELLVPLLFMVALAISDSVLLARLHGLERRVRTLEGYYLDSSIATRISERNDSGDDWQLWSVGKMND